MLYTISFNMEKMESELEISNGDGVILLRRVAVNMRVNQIQWMELKVQIAVQHVDQALDMSVFDIIPRSEVMEEENSHFEIDFDATTCVTKHKLL